MPRKAVNPFEAAVDTVELPPEPETANEPTSVTVPTEFFSKLFTMFAEKMNEGIEKSISAARQVPIDPIKQKQAERAAEAKKSAEDGYWNSLRARAENCSHLREDGSSNWAWAEQSDHVVRGVCQRCQTIASPIRGECVSDAVHAAYREFRKLPDRARSSVLYI